MVEISMSGSGEGPGCASGSAYSTSCLQASSRGGGCTLGPPEQRMFEAMSSLLQGPATLLLAYGAVEVPLLAGLIQGRASLGKLAVSPLLAVPLTALAGAALSFIEPELRSLGLLVQVTGGLSVCAGVGYGTARWMRRRTAPPSGILRRGAIVLDEAADPVRAARGRASRNFERTLPALTLAGHAVPMEDESKHFKLIGTTGTGKSTAISEMLVGALGRGDRAVIADPDGGYVRRFYDPGRGDVILNPFEPRSAKWDLFGEIDNDYDVEQLARSLIPDHEGADRSWRAYARTFFSAVTAQARAAGTREVSELYRLLVVGYCRVENAGRRYPGSTLPRGAQRADVRLHSIGDELGGRCARIRRSPGRPAPLGAGVDPRTGRRSGSARRGHPRRAFHALPRRTNRRVALDNLSVDAASDIRGDEPRGRGRAGAAVVRRR